MWELFHQLIPATLLPWAGVSLTGICPALALAPPARYAIAPSSAR